MNRRDFGRVLAFGVLAGLHRPTAFAQGSETDATAREFSHDTVIAEARQRAGEAYSSPPEADAVLKNLSYDAYRDIRYRTEDQIWAGEERGFTVDLLHTGFVFSHRVDIYLVENGQPRRIPYDPGLFDFGPLAQNASEAEKRGFSGFRLRYPINNSDYLDEFAVFQGATYFRAVGQGQNYGLSARGLAIATGEPKGEEFPQFRTFWIERPKTSAKAVTVHALLDSPSVTGAYKFQIMPGPVTRMEVDATLFARSDLNKLGVAPLTSMFLFNPLSTRDFDDFRTAVHDSDGLLAKRSNGERLWRPLRNPRSLEFSFFEDANPVGFGLIQRSRDISDFNDLEAHYEKRPSAWVEPKDKWGKGKVVLVEIPTDQETNDNIVAFWRPERTLEAGKSLSFGYWLSWGPPPSSGNLAYVDSTRTGLAQHAEGRLFIVDFIPGELTPEALQSDIEPHIWSSQGRIRDTVGHFDLPTNRYRLSFRLENGGQEPIELGAVLRKADKRVSETWLYRWTRQ